MNEQEDQAVKLRFFGVPRLWPYLRGYRGTLALMILLGAISSAIDAVYPLFHRYALDHFVGEQTLGGLGWFIAGYLALLAFQTIINYKNALDCSRMELWPSG